MPFHPDSAAVTNFARVKAFAAIRGGSFENAFKSQPESLQHSRIANLMAKGIVDPILGDNLMPTADSISFLETQRQTSFFAAGMAANSFWRVPFDTEAIASSGFANGSVVEPGAPIPLLKFEFEKKVIERKNAFALAVLTKELLEGGGAATTNTLHKLLASAAARAIDTVIVEQILAHGDTIFLTSSGTTASAFITDFRLMLDHVNVSGAGPLLWVASRIAANNLNYDTTNPVGPQGGELLGLPLIVTDALEDDSAGGVLVLVDCGKIAANVEGIRIDASTEAALQMDNAPTDGSADLVSLFQNNLVGLRAHVIFGFEIMTGFRASVLQGIS